MAIEIKELNVTLNIKGKQATGSSNGASGSGCGGCGDEVNQAKLIEHSVEEVLRILKEQKER